MITSAIQKFNGFEVLNTKQVLSLKLSIKYLPKEDKIHKRSEKKQRKNKFCYLAWLYLIFFSFYLCFFSMSCLILLSF